MIINPEVIKMFYETTCHEYSVGSFIDRYQNEMPQLVMVKHGYQGETGNDTLDTGQVLRIHGVYKQTRILAIVKKDSNRCFGYGDISVSIPQDCNIPVYLIKRNNPVKCSALLHEVIAKHKLPVEVKCDTAEEPEITLKGRKARLIGDIRLKLIQESDLKYMYGNPVNKGQLYRNVVSIPYHMTCLTLSVITGLENGNQDYWASILHSMTYTADNYIKFDGQMGGNDFLTFPTSATAPMEYDFIETNKSYLTTNRRKDPTYVSTKSSIQDEHFYEEIPADRVKSEQLNISNRTKVYSEDSDITETTNLPYENLNKISIPNRTIVSSEDCDNTEIPNLSYENLNKLSITNTTKLSSKVSSEEGDITEISNLPYENLYKLSTVIAKSDSGDLQTLATNTITDLAFENQEYQNTPTSESTNCDYEIRKKLDKTSRKINIVNTISCPPDVENLSVQELGQYLHVLNLGKHEESLSDALIDGSLIKELDENILREEFGFTRFEAIKLMKFARDGYLPKTSQETFL
ncbi:uncharacterized protein LOC127723742 [Mytilus californianus]|uniref:uncharacterized protein LOC127723742 n=1 Tax=Mytilus californianus TaxID=6549 RepID=UPI0022478EDD|nr:uncharacterized protein LOC127723742 [Mytilus californianus]